jgi:hypothetical protein
MFSKIKDGYGDLWKAIIRPPKEEYNIKDLGNIYFKKNKNKGNIK